MAVWYHSPITFGLEPKPIRNGAKINSICITKVPLALYKVYVRVYGGKSDKDLSQTSTHTGKVQKRVNLLNKMLDAFRNAGHHVTMDSVYMGNIMAQIGRFECLIKMIGTAQANWTGAAVKEEAGKMKIGTYKYVLFQHKTMLLCFTVWSDKKLVKTLSNYQTATIIPLVHWVLRKKKGSEGKREMSRSPVPCPQ